MLKESSRGNKTIFMLMALTAITKVFGFVREIVMGRLFGIGDVSEAFRIAQTIPMMLLLVVGTGISTGFIPIYTKLNKEEGEKRAVQYTQNLMKILIIMSVGFALLVTLFPNLFVTLFASGFTGDKLALTLRFTRIAVWGMVFNMVVYVLMPYLQIYDDYTTPALMVIPGNIVFILCFFLGRTHVDLVAMSIIFSALIQMLWLLPASRKKGFKVGKGIDFHDPAFRRLLFLAAPVIIGVAVNQINIIVDKNIASRLVHGGVSALEYANKMNTFTQNIFIYPVAAVFFPQVTRMISEENLEGASKMAKQSLILLALITIPALAGLMAFSEPIIDLVFRGGEFQGEAVRMTSMALFFYALGLFPLAWRDIAIRIFYSNGDTRTPTINAIIGVVLNIVLNIILSRFMGLNGLALATSISAFISSALMIFSIKRFEAFKLDFKPILIKLTKIILATLVMVLLSRLLYSLIVPVSDTLALLTSILMAVIIYGLAVLALRLEEVRTLLSVVKRR